MQDFENSPSAFGGPENIAPPQVGTSFFAKLKTKWPVVLGVIAIFAVLAGGVWGWQRQDASKTSSSLPAGWKRYTNKEYGLQVDYPSDWEKDESEAEFLLYGITFKYEGAEIEGGRAAIDTSPFKPNIRFSVAVKKAPIESYTSSIKDERITDREFAGATWEVYQYKTNRDLIEITSLFTERNGEVFWISQYLDIGDHEAFKDEFVSTWDEILSTFKFLD